MSRWPPIIWILVSLGSLLVLIGVGGDWNPTAFVSGTAAVIVAFLLAMYLAYGRHADRARGTGWLIGGVVAFYVVCAALTLFAGAKYALAAAGAALVPLTAAALLVATTRAKTRGSDDERYETTAGTERDPYPGIGMDDATPLGDTDQHSDARA